jgi:hypothetical protein
MTDIAKSILAIKSDAQVSINAEDINQITWHDGNPTNITNQQITDNPAELQAAYDAKQYQRDRKIKYPEIGDQLDMMWHDKKDDTTTWDDAVQAVKDAYPK